MGSCISKCSPKSQFKVEEDDQFCNHIQDKLIISTQPIKPTTPIPSHHHHSNKISPFPSSPPHSTSSAPSSFSYSTTTTSSISTLSNCSSSTSTSSKIDRLFSNEFLRSCYNQNPHISRIAIIKEAQKPITLVTSQQPSHHSKTNPINRGNARPNYKTTTPQKRVRTSTPSPTLKRQKSFRKEEPVITRTSPSPSRRFNQNNEAEKRNRGSVVMGDPPKMGSNSRQKYPSGLKTWPCLKSQPVRETQTRIHRISSKIDEVAVKEAMDHDHYMECVPEDIDNPLISLDCFIFL